MTTISLEFCRDRRRTCRKLGDVIRDRHYTEDIHTLLARLREQIKGELEQAVSQVAVVVHAAETALMPGRDPATRTHLTTAVAMVEAALPEGRIRWAAEAVATLNQLYVVPRRGLRPL